MVTLVPSRLVGAFEPWKSLPSHKRAPVARLVPLISSQDPELKVARLPKSVRLPMDAITGVLSVQVPLPPPVDVRLNCTLRAVPGMVAVMTTGPTAPSLAGRHPPRQGPFRTGLTLRRNEAVIEGRRYKTDLPLPVGARLHEGDSIRSKETRPSA